VVCVGGRLWCVLEVEDCVVWWRQKIVMCVGGRRLCCVLKEDLSECWRKIMVSVGGRSL
jgi:hypothetical protein